jgi:hypothetical protein
MVKVLYCASAVRATLFVPVAPEQVHVALNPFKQPEDGSTLLFKGQGSPEQVVWLLHRFPTAVSSLFAGTPAQFPPYVALVTVMTGVALTAVPESPTCTDESCELTVRLLESVPTAVGLYLTVTEQLAPAAKAEPQVLV